VRTKKEKKKPSAAQNLMSISKYNRPLQSTKNETETSLKKKKPNNEEEDNDPYCLFCTELFSKSKSNESKSNTSNALSGLTLSVLDYKKKMAVSCVIFVFWLAAKLPMSSIY